MEIIYKTKDGKEFTDKDKAEKWESLQRTAYSEHIDYYKVHDIISPEELKAIFQIDSVYSMTLLLRDEDGDITEDSNYETFSLDETGHLDCTDFSHGLLEWSEKENSYFRIVHGREWKVELLGVKDVIYL